LVTGGIMKKRLGIGFGLALAAGLIVALALPASHFTLLGWLRRESFYQGRPTSYWISALKKDAFVGSSAPADVGKLLREGGEHAVPVLLDMAKDEDEVVSEQALLALYLMKPRSEKVIQVLSEILKYRIRQPGHLLLATDILLYADRQQAIAALIGAVRENQQGPIRARVAGMLGNLVPDDGLSHSQLTRATGSMRLGAPPPNPEEVEARALWLREPEAQSVIAALREALQDEDVSVRVTAARGLWQLGCRGELLVPVLCQALKAGNWVACSVLGQIGPQAKAAIPALIEVLQDQQSPIVLEATQALGSIGGEDPALVPALLAVAHSSQGNARIRGEAFRVLGKICPEKAVQLFSEALKDPEASIRQQAAYELASSGRALQSAVPALITALADADAGVRSAAAYALGRMGSQAQAAVPALSAAVKSPEESVRCAAADALGRIGPAAKSAVPALATALKDDKAIVRSNAAGALWAIEGPASRVLPILLELLKEKEARWYTISVLRRMAGQAKAAVPALTMLLDDDDPRVREAAADALKEIEPRAAPKAGDSNEPAS
jgi:HEAT repeat protein